jgi:hypothetical protein
MCGMHSKFLLKWGGGTPAVYLIVVTNQQAARRNLPAVSFFICNAYDAAATAQVCMVGDRR